MTRTNAQDYNGRVMISRGTTVRVRTTNGGDTVAVLAENHYPTYDVVLADRDAWFIIPSFRVSSVEIAD